MTHDLKIWPEHFRAIWDRRKTFEVRNDYRGYTVGDELILREWDPETREYTGSACVRRVSYILRASGHFGIADGVVVMSLEDVTP